MKKQENDFKKNNKSDDPYNPYYDTFEDWELIEASFAMQYGIRLEHEHDMSWTEFFNLMTGLTHDTPLGLVVGIRAETDRDRIKGFNKDQHKIRNEWRRKIDNKNIKNMTEKDKKQSMKEIQEMFKNMFS